MTKILLVEDDQNLLTTIKEWLEFEHHIVEAVDNGLSGLELLGSYKYDLIILDWELPKLSGLELCRAFREKGGQAPVLFLTGRGTIPDKEAGFDAGADDYLTKPFHMKELSARVKALLRRPAAFVDQVLKAGNLVLDRSTYQVTRSGEEVYLARMEFALLEFFMRHPNKVFSPEAILERVWSAESDRSPETLRTCLKKLRNKIDTQGQPSMIKNLHGVGYKFEAPDSCPRPGN